MGSSHPVIPAERLTREADMLAALGRLMGGGLHPDAIAAVNAGRREPGTVLRCRLTGTACEALYTRAVTLMRSAEPYIGDPRASWADRLAASEAFYVAFTVADLATSVMTAGLPASPRTPDGDL